MKKTLLIALLAMTPFAISMVGHEDEAEQNEILQHQSIVDAVINQNIPLLKSLIANGADLNAIAGAGEYAHYSLLDIAAHLSNPEMVTLLANAGANPNRQVRSSLAPNLLGIALNSSNFKILHQLIRAGLTIPRQMLNEVADRYAKHHAPVIAALLVQPRQGRSFDTSRLPALPAAAAAAPATSAPAATTTTVTGTPVAAAPAAPSNRRLDRELPEALITAAAQGRADYVNNYLRILYTRVNLTRATTKPLDVRKHLVKALIFATVQGHYDVARVLTQQFPNFGNPLTAEELQMLLKIAIDNNRARLISLYIENNAPITGLTSTQLSLLAQHAVENQMLDLIPQLIKEGASLSDLLTALQNEITSPDLAPATVGYYRQLINQIQNHLQVTNPQDDSYLSRLPYDLRRSDLLAGLLRNVIGINPPSSK